jgi:hypothetical protein
MALALALVQPRISAVEPAENADCGENCDEEDCEHDTIIGI